MPVVRGLEDQHTPRAIAHGVVSQVTRAVGRWRDVC